MKIIVLADIHGEKSYFQPLKGLVSEVDLVLLAGDITHFGKRKQAEEMIHTLQPITNTILAIPGNCDYPEVSRFLAEAGVSLHCRYREVQDIHFMGVGGSLPCPGKTPFEFSDEELGEFLNLTYEDSLAKKPFILLTHQPPYNTINDKVDGWSVGSKQVRRFIEDTQPMLCVCGHIHEGIGIDTIGSTKIINPGPFRNGYYAYVNIVNKQIVSLELKCL